MSQAPAPTVPGFRAAAGFRRFSVAEFHRMIDAGVLADDDPVELLEGWMVLKMPRNPAHDGASDLLEGAVGPLLPAGWFLRSQKAVTLPDSQPEPDLAVVRGDRRAYLTRHPGPADVGLLAEVANTSLDRDRLDKGRIYARVGIPVYWVVNLTDGVVEVYTAPSGPTASPAYGRKQEYRRGDVLPVVLDGAAAGAVAAADLLP